jgi:hypothetical protein
MEKDKYSFLDTLDEEQAKNANLIIDGAIKRGLNPKLAVALAYQESGLRHADKDKVKIGADGEIGLMQIKIPTGKMQGYKPEQLNTLQGNVDAGLDYLKSGFDRYNDPVLAAAGYNAGYDHPYFSNPEKHDLPKSTWSYLESIKGYGGFDEQDKKAEAPTTENVVTPASEEDFRTEKAAAAGALLGGGLGAAKSALSMFSPAQTPPGGVPPGGAPQRGFGGATPGEKWAQKVTGYVKPGVQDVVEAATDYRRAMPGGKVSGPLAKKWGIPSPGEPTGIMDRLMAKQNTPPPPGPNAGQQAMQGVKGALGAISRSPMAMGALTGASIAGGAQEAQTRYKAGDIPGAVIAGAGAVGGGLSMIPTIPTRVLGAGMATASPAALAVLDKMRSYQPEERHMLGMPSP